MSTFGTDGAAASAIAPEPPTSVPPGPMARRRPAAGAVLVANLVAQVVIVVTGGAVRLTASGLGCAAWPQCQPGHFTPTRHAESAFHQTIEFGNRTLTGVLTLIAIAVVLLVCTDRARSRGYRALGAVPLAGVLLQALVGGVVVLADLSPGWVALHYLISAALIAASTVLLYRFREGDGPPEPTVDRPTVLVARALATVLPVVLILGTVATGSGPHGGDEDVAYRFAVDPVAVSRLHSVCVWVFAALLTVLAYRILRRPAAPPGPAVPAGPAGPGARRAVLTLAAVTLVQGAIGYAQYATGLPIGLVGLHMLGSALLIVATTWTLLTLRVRRAPAG